MRNQNLIIVGVVLMAVGLMFLFGNLFDINLAAFCFPVGLIVLGFFLLIRPRMVAANTRSDVLFIGDLERTAPWNVTDEELWSFIGDVTYDLTSANVPKGQTTIRNTGFISDIEIVASKDVGVTISITSMVTSFTPPGQEEEDYFLSPVHWQNAAAAYAERQVRFELVQFIAEVSVREY